MSVLNILGWPNRKYEVGSFRYRFFGFGGAARKKTSTTTPPNAALLQQTTGTTSLVPHTGVVPTSAHVPGPVHPAPVASAGNNRH